MASDAERMTPTFARGNETLLGASVRALWPTPMGSDWRSGLYDGAGTNARPLREVALCLSLTDATLRGGSSRLGQPPSTRGMVLNPRFVEALMGFPDGWTAADSKRWGTQLFLLPPPEPG
jgi:hypothetical protein